MKVLLVIIISVLSINITAQQEDTTQGKKQFIYILKLTEKYWHESAWNQEASNTINLHFKHLQDMLTEGKLILAGRTEASNDKTMGICIFEAASLEEAKEIAMNDPAVKAGIMAVEVFPYKIALTRK